jgi:peptide/nickel transport system ATP-binding protein
MLNVRDLFVEFSGEGRPVTVVKNLSLAVRKGEIVAVVGESGSGKSVSALSILGLLPGAGRVTQGNIELDGTELLKLDEPSLRAMRGRKIGMIFQDPMTALNPVMTIGAQLIEPLQIHLAMTTGRARARAVELLGLVGIPDPQARLDQYPHQFSGGMRQRVMIAIGLACGPELLIADEPTTALDVTIQAQILDLMQDLCKRLGVALIIITHNLGVVARYADRVLIMYAGQLMEQGPAAAVFAAPRHLYTAGLLASVPRLGGALSQRLEAIEGLPPNPRNVPPGCSFAPRCPHVLPQCSGVMGMAPTDVDSLSACVRAGDMAAGRIQWHSRIAAGAPELKAVQDAPAVIDDAPLIRVENLEKTYSIRAGMFGKKVDIQAVRDVSLTIGRQEALGLVGESGCGKSTLGKLLLRLEEPTSGRILFHDQDITHLGDNDLRAFRRQCQVVFQDPYASLNPHQRIGEIVAEPLRVHKIARNRNDANQVAAQLLLDVGLRTDLFDRFPHQLSGGQRQRVGIARALAMKPSFVICDEAVSALDVSVQAQVLNLLGDLKERLRLSYLFIGHDLAVVRQIATRVMVMYLGRVVEVADCGEFYTNPLHPYTQALLAAAPSPDPERERSYKTVPIRGEPPSPSSPPSGCAFRTRCPVVMAECSQELPKLREVKPGHQVACLRFQ